MKINYNVTGTERKKLVKLISEITEVPSKYLGVPSCAYQVGPYHIEKDGELTFDTEVVQADIKTLMKKLQDAGFKAEVDEPTPNEAEPEETGLIIQIPKDSLSDEDLEKLAKLLEAKGNLIKKALNVDALPIEADKERISFPWFSKLPNPEEIKAYSQFITKLCEMAKTQKRITIKDKEVDNEKYAFRCFLLRLGFIGEEFKNHRKILLQNLSGSSAFKGGAPNETDK
ncbi:virulence protein [Soehngenia longivitae]|uniref:Virulence protein n=1 Tax=Soehngenia longivitae TaxID=2562294 RepID=A0A4Z0D9T2_9FIRM|nr:virulence protein [Soehngenia longivitae]TFZ41630.1 virulence protein [Soehngenia longivitae]